MSHAISCGGDGDCSKTGLTGLMCQDAANALSAAIGGHVAGMGGCNSSHFNHLPFAE